MDTDIPAEVPVAASGTAPWIALVLLVALYGVPLLHVALARGGGGWKPPPGSRCPFGPRAGWLVMVLMLGPVGWLLFALRRPRSPASDPRKGAREGGVKSGPSTAGQS